MKRALVAFLPLGLWAAAVLTVGSLHFGSWTAGLPSRSDKVAHFLMYGVGGALAAWAGRVNGDRAGYLGVLVVLLTGAVDELRQSTLPYRDADIFDWVADATGAFFAFLAARRLLHSE